MEPAILETGEGLTPWSHLSEIIRKSADKSADFLNIFLRPDFPYRIPHFNSL